MRYYVTGKIFPERTSVGIGKITLPVDKGEITFNCDASQITMILDKTDMDEYSAFIYCKEIATIVVSSLGFAKGCGYNVEIITIQNDKLDSNVYGVAKKELANENLNKAAIDKIFTECFTLSMWDVFLRFALSDYTKAIVSEIECPFLCYRAIETLKARFGINKEAWEKMHEKLQTNKDDIIFIKEYADPIRHGNIIKFKHTNEQERIKILLITKDIIVKYISYTKKETEKQVEKAIENHVKG